MKEKNNIFKSKTSKIINILFFVVIISGLGLIFLNNKDRLTEYKTIILNINYFHIFIVLAITILASVFRSWRWYYLLVPIKRDVSWKNTLRVTINALATNYSMPGKLGVPVKAVLLKKSEKINVSRSLPSILGEIFVEHSSEFLVAVFCVMIGGHLSKIYRTFNQIVENATVLQNILISGSLILLIISAGIIFKKKLKSLNFFEKFTEAVKSTGSRLDCILFSYLITIFNLVISYWAFQLMLSTLGHPEVGFTFVFFAGTITNIVGLLSPFPGGIGVRELTIYGLYDFYFGLGGIAFLSMVLMRIITYFALFLLFILERTISGLLNAQKLETV